MEWWLEHRHGWLVKRQWVGSWLGRVTRDEYQVLGSTSIPARLDTLVYRESFSWLTSVGTTRNTVNRLGWSRIRLAVLILNAAGAGLIGRPAVISGRYNKCHSLPGRSSTPNVEGLPDLADLPDLVIPDVDSCTGNDTVLYTIYWRNCTVPMLSDVFINLEILNTPLILVIMLLQDNNIFKKLISGIMDSLTGFQDNLVQS